MGASASPKPAGRATPRAAEEASRPFGDHQARVRPARQDFIVLAVTGGRSYADQGHVWRVLDEEYAANTFAALVQGECPDGGADLLAKKWCRARGVACIGIEALWKHFGRPAGPIRNQWMFDFLPVYRLVAFPGHRGTSNAVERANSLGVPVRDERGGD